MTRALERGEGSASRPGRFLPPGKTRHPLYRRLGGPQSRSRQVRKISPSPGFEPRIVQSIASRLPEDIKWKSNQCNYELKINSNPDVFLSPNGRDIRENNADIWRGSTSRFFCIMGTGTLCRCVKLPGRSFELYFATYLGLHALFYGELYFP